VNTVSLEVGWHRVLWAVQPGNSRTVLFGEVALAGPVREAVKGAANEARLALAAEDTTAGLEVVVAFDGSLLWPLLHGAAREVLLVASAQAEPRPDAYDDEVDGRLVRSLLDAKAVVRLAPQGEWNRRAAEVASAAPPPAKLRAVALSLRGARERPSEERAAERALREAMKGPPIMISSDIAPLWGWGDHPVEKTLVSAALLPIVEDAAQGAREGLGDAEVHVWLASLDGTLVPLTLAERHPYAVMRGLPILSLTAALAYGRQVPGEGPFAAASLHETSCAVARVGTRPQGQSFESVLMGARIESLGVGAESRLFMERGALTLADDRAPSGALPVRSILAAAGLGPGPGGAGATLAEWLGKGEEEAVGIALAAIADRLGTRMRAAFSGATLAVFAGPLAGALAGPLAKRAQVAEALIPPAFAACGAVAARQAPRASRAAESHEASPSGWAPAQVARAVEELLAVAVADLEDAGMRRDGLAAVGWIGGVRDAHGIYPAMDRESIARAAEEIAKRVPREGRFTLEVEVYPASGERSVRFPELTAPVTAQGAQRVVAPGAVRAVELRIVPSGALSAESPTAGPALLADPTGLIFVPEGLEARPAPLGGTRLRHA
jgi:hypothetical protein